MMSHRPKINKSTDDDFTGNIEATSMVGKKTLKNRPKPKQSKKTKKNKRKQKVLKKHPLSLVESARNHFLPYKDT